VNRIPREGKKGGSGGGRSPRKRKSGSQMKTSNAKESSQEKGIN